MSCSFQRFLRESDKRPRELCLQIDGVILDAICQPRVQTPASFNSFQTDERFFEGPLSGFQFKWHRICKTRSNNRAFC